MPDLGRFLNWAGLGAAWVDSFARAEGVEYMLGHRGVSVVLVREGEGALPAQTVLLFPASQSRLEVEGEAGEASTIAMTVVGPRDHSTLPDLDIRRGDRFRYPNVQGGTQYEVTHVDLTQPGKVEARAMAAE